MDLLLVSTHTELHSLVHILSLGSQFTDEFLLLLLLLTWTVALSTTIGSQLQFSGASDWPSAC